MTLQGVLSRLQNILSCLSHQKMINVTCTTELNRQKAIAVSVRTALSATDNNSSTLDNSISLLTN